MIRFCPLRQVLAACALLFAAGAAGATSASVSVTDDANHSIILPQPARRIVSMAPHATELIFAAGAGAAVVAVSEYSNYPPQAGKLPSVGGVAAIDLERVIAFKPDLVVAWGSGNSSSQIARLRGLGIPVFESEPRSFATIATSIERLSRLAGTEAAGSVAANQFRAKLANLRTAYQQRPTVTVFYQIWRSPLMTLNGGHLVSEAIRVCGGENIFGRLPQLAPTVDTEAVVKARPEVIIDSSDATGDGFAVWRRFPALPAVARDNLFSIDGSLMNRASPRVLEGAEALCKFLETARGRRR